MVKPVVRLAAVYKYVSSNPYQDSEVFHLSLPSEITRLILPNVVQNSRKATIFKLMVPPGDYTHTQTTRLPSSYTIDPRKPHSAKKITLPQSNGSKTSAMRSREPLNYGQRTPEFILNQNPAYHAPL